jgi:hypothetical protein
MGFWAHAMLCGTCAIGGLISVHAKLIRPKHWQNHAITLLVKIGVTLPIIKLMFC